MKLNKGGSSNEFYCTECGKKGIPIWRKGGSQREAGHLKKLFCLNCKKETNHVECQPFTKYTKEDFNIEFEYCNFKNGKRIREYNKLKELIYNGWTKEEIIHNDRDPGIRKKHMASES